jgi:DNA-binding XRE family transcriptional regulator
MKANKNIRKKIDFQVYLKRQLKDAKLKEHYNQAVKQLEIAYQVAQLRKQYDMSQSELAKKLGTTQGNIARIESGQQNFTTLTLQKIANVFKRDLRIEFI